MTIEFQIQNEKMHLIYSPRDGNEWVLKKLKNEEEVIIRRTFNFSKSQLIKSKKDRVSKIKNTEDVRFLFAKTHENYWNFDKNILNTKRDVLIHKDIFIQNAELENIERFFIVDYNISIFNAIDNLCDEQIVIGGDKPNAIPLKDFNFLIKNFPTPTEKKYYANSRVTNILKEYFGSMSDGEEKLQKYFQGKEKRLDEAYNKPSVKKINIPIELYQSEVEKFSGIAEIINEQLNDNSDSYSEADWQNLIVDILPIIFPQYVAVLSGVSIKESYSKELKLTRREIDFVLVNANGYIDILEIKKPFASCILRTSKYRDNYIPKSELAGTVMQVEKYIYYLNSLTKNYEDKLTKKYKDQLPSNLKIKIRNPKGFILLGRSNKFSAEQKNDFEFIKRKYANIIDLLTYDDLLTRIKNIISSLEGKIK